jgi:hypothetical protein
MVNEEEGILQLGWPRLRIIANSIDDVSLHQIYPMQREALFG